MLQSSHYIPGIREIRSFRSCPQATGPSRTYRGRVRVAGGELLERDHRQRRAPVVDLTDRTLVEDRLRLQSAALTSADDAILITDARGYMAWVNPAFTRLTGYTAEEAVGQTPRLLKSNRHDQVVYKELWETISSGRVWRGELINRRKDGSLYNYEQTITPILNARGTVSHFVGITHDISKRKQAEAALSASEERYRALVEAIHEDIFIVSREGCLEYVNASAANNLGVRADQVVGQRLDELFPPHVARQQRRQLGRVLATRESLYTEDQVDFPGRTVWLGTWLVPLRDHAGEVKAVVGVARDITDRKQVEEQFRQAQKMEAIGQLAGGIAHDFNNLLTAILGYSELVLDRIRDHPDIAADVEEIQKAGERASRLAQQLLAFSRRQLLVPQILDLNQVVGDFDKMLKRVISENIRFDVVAAPSLERTKADPGQVEQLLMNLVINARDAMPQGGTLTIATANVVLDPKFARRHVGALPGRYVSLTVQDTGCGMTPDVLAHVFEPFFTTKGPAKGTGLGLSTVYGVVKQSGGYISIESTPGFGTTVTTYWPRVDAPEASAVAAPPSTNTGKGTETILLVEDEGGLRGLMRKALKRYGYTVLEAHDVADAIAIEEGRRGPIHLLLSDVIMPGLNGPDLAQRIVRRRPAIKVLFASGYASRPAIDLGSSLQNVSFLPKPFTPETLARKVRERLDAQVGQPGRESTFL